MNSFNEEQLMEFRQTMIEYLKVKTLAEDWHAVSDAANDLREIDIRLDAIRLKF